MPFPAINSRMKNFKWFFQPLLPSGWKNHLKFFILESLAGKHIPRAVYNVFKQRFLCHFNQPLFKVAFPLNEKK